MFSRIYYGFDFTHSINISKKDIINDMITFRRTINIVIRRHAWLHTTTTTTIVINLTHAD